MIAKHTITVSLQIIEAKNFLKHYLITTNNAIIDNIASGF